MNEVILAKGAEAIILLDKNQITKDRIKKNYRIKELDDTIRKSRTKSETKLLFKASEIINAPRPTKEFTKSTYTIKMPYIKGKKLSDNLDKFSLKKQKEICRLIGDATAKLHDADIIHGDLTTSNMILSESSKNPTSNLTTSSIKRGDNNSSIKRGDNNSSLDEKNSLTKKRGDNKNASRAVGGDGSGKKPKLYFIDFGLGFISHKFEDKAVDLHLLRQALEAKHFRHWEALFKEVLKSYSKSKDNRIVLERLKAVEKRGRYKH